MTHTIDGFGIGAIVQMAAWVGSLALPLWICATRLREIRDELRKK